MSSRRPLGLRAGASYVVSGFSRTVCSISMARPATPDIRLRSAPRHAYPEASRSSLRCCAGSLATEIASLREHPTPQAARTESLPSKSSGPPSATIAPSHPLHIVGSHSTCTLRRHDLSTRANYGSSRPMDTITTTIKREWLREIVAGRKKVEYRELKPYWVQRLSSVQAPFILRLINGMTTHAPEVVVIVRRVRKNSRMRRFELHLGSIKSVRHWDRRLERPR